jgi:hypothetical protein
MGLVRAAALSLVVLSSFTNAVFAETRCSMSPVRVCDGCHPTSRWTVTKAGPDPKHNYCSVSWSSMGGHVQFEMIQQPQLGEGHFKDYRVIYRGDKLGRDTMVVKMSWLSPSNRTMTGTVTYDIDVVDHQ